MMGELLLTMAAHVPWSLTSVVGHATTLSTHAETYTPDGAASPGSPTSQTNGLPCGDVSRVASHIGPPPSGPAATCEIGPPVTTAEPNHAAMEAPVRRWHTEGRSTAAGHSTRASPQSRNLVPARSSRQRQPLTAVKRGCAHQSPRCRQC